MGAPTVIKQPSESRLFTMEFAALLSAGETVTGVTSVVTSFPVAATVPPLVISGIIYSGTQCQFRLAGGLNNTRYKVTAVVTTSGGNTIEGEGFVQCTDI